MLIDELKKIVGPKGWTTNSGELEPHLTEWRGAVRGRCLIMILPASTSEVSAVIGACAGAGVGVVPQGGNTGMCAGAVPDDSGEQVILNMSRMNRIRSLDAQDFSAVAEAGCILKTVQDAAHAAERYFPLSLGGEGSCQIGGNVSTNAGGINVLRYGTMRELVLGLEVVLADGTVWHGLKTLRKDTAGYDLKQLFVGSEGTLGVVTAVAVKLYPLPGPTTTAMIGMNSAEQAVALLGELREDLADCIDAFELINARALDLVLRHIPNTRAPFERNYPWYVLAVAAADPEKQLLESRLLKAAEEGTISNAVIAKNTVEADHFWHMRHSISEAEKREGEGLKHDISIPIGRMQEFLLAGEQRLSEQVLDAALVAFGHVGDGNLHYNVQLPEGCSKEQLVSFKSNASRIIYELVTEMGGSISAEHGIGLLKKTALLTYKSKVEIELMRDLKNTLDPLNILNPGKVI